MSRVSAWAATAPGLPLQAFDFDPGALQGDQVDIAVQHCGICHSDLSMLDNEWGASRYPLVPGHEIIGKVVACGEQVQGLQPGDMVGVGWNAGSCMHCRRCHGGDPHLCASVQPTIMGRHGGFAQRVRAQAGWTIPLPAGLHVATAGPLLCAGITVFAPLLELGVRPTDRVGVVGIGGLGHLAIAFLRAWGCEVTVFTSSPGKHQQARELGAHRVLATHDKSALDKIAGSLDLILDTVNAPLQWARMLSALAPRGRLHVVGAVLEPMAIPAFALISGQKSVSGSPTGSREAIQMMLDFATRHDIRPMVERFPMSEVNAAIAHLRDGKARYRVILDADFEPEQELH